VVVVGIIAGVDWIGEKIDQARQDSADPVLARLPGGGNVLHVAYSPDGKRIATMTPSGTVWVLNAETGERVHSIDPGKVNYRSFAFSADGSRLAIGGQTRLASGPESREKGGGASVWDATAGKKLFALAEGHTYSVGYIAYSPDGTRLATTSGDATVQVWDGKTGEKLLDLEGHTEGVLCVGFSPDGSRLVTGSGDGTVRLLDAATGEEARTIEIKVELPVGEKDRDDLKGKKPVGEKDLDDVSQTQFSRDGKQVLGVGRSGCWTWGAATGNEIRSIRFEAPGKVPAQIAIHPDTNRLATAHSNLLAVRHLMTGQITHQFRIKPGFLLDLSNWEVKSVAFSPDGTRVVGGTHDGAIWLWKLNE
jgi:WD40 repeat protein